MILALPNLVGLFFAVAAPLVVWWCQSYRGKCVLSSAQREEFFKYTSGRWLYNEKKQLGVRYVWFNVEALQEIAATVIGAKYCTKMLKTHEGSYNKIFLLKFDNNQEIIAKIPTKLIPPFYTTASEVATIDYARTVLNLPVPEVLAYSARANSTPVGSEFILMRRTPGTELGKLWDSMRDEDANQVIDQVLCAESQFRQYQFSQIGSIYYTQDVEPCLRARPLYKNGSGSEPGAEKFRIGPSTEWALWRGSRATLRVDRGPWPDVQSYIQGVVRIHQAWLADCARAYTVSVPPRNLEDLDRKTHHQLLNTLIRLSSKVRIPPEFCEHVLWHKDLHAKNIMATSSSPPSIMLIDWQNVSVGPLFHQATFAIFARYHGDSRINLFNNAQLPEYFQELPWHKRIYLGHQRRLALRHLYYSSRTERASLDAQCWSHEVPLRSAIDEASRTWDTGLGPFREHISNLAAASGIRDFEVLQSKNQDCLMAYKDRVRRLYRGLEIEGDGWVPNERYDDAYAMNMDRMQCWDEAAAGGPYPIVDGAPSWFVDS